MFQIGEVLVSREVMEEEFVCNLSACRGACCVEGDAGAPVEPAEAETLEKEYDKISPFLREEGRAAIASQGKTVIDPNDGEQVTPLVEGAECAYVVFDEKGTSKCGIEKAWEAGATSFRKPVSCHLYPIRILSTPKVEAVNYHRWPICAEACTLGKELKVPVYRFTKEALIRKYGDNWYRELEKSVEAWQQREGPDNQS